MRNSLVLEGLDMQDIRGDDYALRPPLRSVLRLEGLGALLVALSLYHAAQFSWGQFALWFLLPDAAILVYVFGNARIGAVAYNMTHSAIGAALTAIAGVWMNDRLLQQIALIWWAHIGFDRALGYGLKYSLGFRVTHLGVLKGRKHLDGGARG